MINIIICDDDKNYGEILEYKINKVFENDLKLEYNIGYTNCLDNLERKIKNDKIDIVFLDVMINDCNSIDWLIEKSKSDLKNAQFIIMTAFPIESYRLSETESCYFLIKSKLTDEQLKSAINRAANRITKMESNQKIIKSGKTNHTINLQEIVYIETFNNSILIHMATGENYPVYTTLKEFEKDLTPSFLRCHKSYMVNMNYISGYEPHKFLLKNNEQVSIPPKKYTQIIDKYRNYLISL